MVACFGDLHNHCGISYGHGELHEALANAALRLDFVSITGHADWPDMDAEDPRIAHIVAFHKEGFAKLRTLWDWHLGELAGFEETHGVVTYPGYEIHSNEHGDYTIVGRDHQMKMILANSPPELRGELGRRFGSAQPPPVLAFPHHLGYRPGARGVNWDSFSQTFSPVVEIYSMHGLAENDSSDKPSLHSMGPFQAYGTVQHGLSRGLRFGVIGNTDHHSGHPGSYGHGLTGVWSDSSDRDAIWEAIFARRTWAMTGDTVRLWFAVGDAPMGSTLAGGLSKRNVTIEVEASAAIDYVELVVDGAREELWWHETPALDQHDGAIASVELGWGERGVPASWEVELQTRGASITAVYPRFRGPEVVSPLDTDGKSIPTHHASWHQGGDHEVSFSAMSWGNMTNSTPSTQGLGLRLDRNDGELQVLINGRAESHSIAKLLAGSVSGNLGAIDSPAFLLSAVSVRECARTITTTMPSRPAGWAYVRVRLKNGHWAITSPVFAE